MAQFDPYAILGVSPDAPAFVIQAAYRACIKRYHPDQYDGADARQRTADIIEAWRQIGDEAARARYDSARATSRARAESPRASAPPPPESPPVRSRPVPQAEGADRKLAAHLLPVAGVIAFATIAALLNGTFSRGARGIDVREARQPAASAPPAPTTDPAIVGSAMVISGGPVLDDVLRFTDPARCGMATSTEKLFTSLIAVDPKTYEGAPGPAIRLPGFSERLQPTFERRVNQSAGYDVRDNEATLTVAGTWLGLNVSRLRYRFMESSSFREMQVRFLERPERVRQVLNGFGFALPPVGEFKKTSGADEVSEGMGVEAIRGGATLTCGSSMYY